MYLYKLNRLLSKTISLVSLGFFLFVQYNKQYLLGTGTVPRIAFKKR